MARRARVVAGAADRATSASPARRRRGTGPASAFRYRGFKVFWLGALVSNTGTWVQNVTIPFVLYRMTSSAAWVGAAGFAQFLPGVVLSPLGGALADRYDRRRVIVVCQAAMATVAGAIWVVWLAGVRSPWALLGLVGIGGLVAGVNIPSWQAFVSELVPREALAQAISLNSAQFNLARAFGPAVGGVVLSVLGVSWAFLINAVSFGTVLGALAVVRPARRELPRGPRPGVLAQFAEGVRDVRGRPAVVTALAVLGAVSFFGQPVLQMLTVIVRDTYGAGAAGLGVLTAAFGVGAAAGVPLRSLWPEATPSRVVSAALVLYAAGVVGVALAPSIWFGTVAVAAAGVAYIPIVATLVATVQLAVPDAVRGRAMAIFVMGFNLGYPLGSMAEGRLADAIGVRPAVGASAAALVAIVVALRARPGAMRRLDLAFAVPPG